MNGATAQGQGRIAARPPIRAAHLRTDSWWALPVTVVVVLLSSKRPIRNQSLRMRISRSAIPTGLRATTTPTATTAAAIRSAAS